MGLFWGTDRNLWDDENGDCVTARHENEWLRWVFVLFSRRDRILEGGLGFGQARRGLIRRARARKLRTVEQRQQMIDMWRASKVDDDDSDEFVDSPEDADYTVEQGDISQVVQQEANRATKRIDAVFLDVPEDLIDASFKQALAGMFVEAQRRVVIVWRHRSDLVIPGFVGVRAVHPRDQRPLPLFLFDRWEPSAGIGTPVGAGKIRVPGAGWVTP